MTLDLFTVTVMAALVASVASITFILETVIRRDTGPGRLWAVGFFCGLATTIAYMAWSAGVGGVVSIAVGNTLFVLVPGFVWLGARRFNDRAVGVALGLVGAMAAATFFAALLAAPSPGGWGGWTTMAASLVALFVAGGSECVRSPMGRIRTSWALSGVLLFAALFYGVRFVVVLVVGPDGPLFSGWFGSVSASFVTIVLTMVAVIVTSVLRSHRTAERRYEWLTEGGVAADGVMLERTFTAASSDTVERASWRSEGVALIVIRVEGLTEIRTAFGQEVGDAISGACRQAVRRYAPASAIVGEAGDDQLAVRARAHGGRRAPPGRDHLSRLHGRARARPLGSLPVRRRGRRVHRRRGVRTRAAAGRCARRRSACHRDPRRLGAAGRARLAVVTG
jgi:GGDEF domain-containing protein